MSITNDFGMYMLPNRYTPSITSSDVETATEKMPSRVFRAVGGAKGAVPEQTALAEPFRAEYNALMASLSGGVYSPSVGVPARFIGNVIDNRIIQ